MRIFGLLIALLTGALPLTARADDVTALLGKHKSFAGWQFGDAAMMSSTATQTTVDEHGKPLYVDTIRRIGAVYRMDEHDVKANSDSSTGFTGNVFWYSDNNGFTVPIIGNAARVALAEDLFFTDGVALLPWSLTGKRTMWGKTYDVIRVKQQNAAGVELLVDPATGEYGGATIDPKGDNEENIHVLAYGQPLPGKNIISRWQYGDERTEATQVIDPIHFGSQLSNSDLHPPAPKASWMFSSAEPFPVTIAHRRIIVKAKFNGVEGTFLLDSGAADIFLSGAFARRARIAAIGHSEAYTLDGTEKTDVGIVRSLEIGGNELRDVTVRFGSADVDEDAPDGLLGFGLLAGTFTTVDFQHSTIQIQNPTAIDDATLSGIHVGVDLSDGTPRAPMQIQGNAVTVNATFDTGSPTYVLIPWKLPEDYGLHLSGANGCGKLDSMTLGPIIYDSPSTCITGALTGRSALVGLDFLKGLAKLQFDYPHAVLIMVPSKN